MHENHHHKAASSNRVCDIASAGRLKRTASFKNGPRIVRRRVEPTAACAESKYTYQSENIEMDVLQMALAGQGERVRSRTWNAALTALGRLT